jgi:CRP-like cAMP-binding protein
VVEAPSRIQYGIASDQRNGKHDQLKIFESLHIADKAAFQNSLADLPVVTYQPGETVIVDGSKTGRLLILKKGNVAIVKEDTEIAKVAEPGAVFGELSLSC